MPGGNEPPVAGCARPAVAHVPVSARPAPVSTGLATVSIGDASPAAVSVAVAKRDAVPAGKHAVPAGCDTKPETGTVQPAPGRRNPRVSTSHRRVGCLTRRLTTPTGGSERSTRGFCIPTARRTRRPAGKDAKPAGRTSDRGVLRRNRRVRPILGGSCAPSAASRGTSPRKERPP